MIDSIENFCEVCNNGSKAIIVALLPLLHTLQKFEITKHDVRDVKQFRCCAMRSTKT